MLGMGDESGGNHDCKNKLQMGDFILYLRSSYYFYVRFFNTTSSFSSVDVLPILCYEPYEYLIFTPLFFYSNDINQNNYKTSTFSSTIALIEVDFIFNKIISTLNICCSYFSYLRLNF
jgi:hypothetical protein